MAPGTLVLGIEWPSATPAHAASDGANDENWTAGCGSDGCES